MSANEQGAGRAVSRGAVEQIRVSGIWAGYWEMDKVCQYLGDLQKFVFL